MAEAPRVNVSKKIMRFQKKPAFVFIVVILSIFAAVVVTKIVYGGIKESRKKAQKAEWRIHKWPEERQAIRDQIKARQLTNTTTKAVIIDLKPYINTALTDSPSSPKGIKKNHLGEVPLGKNIYGGVPFDVEGSIQLMGGGLAQLRKKYPEKVENIRIDKVCSNLYLFHGSGFVDWRKYGEKVAKLVLHYEDGSVREIDLVSGTHVFDWWAPLFTTGVDAKYYGGMSPGTERAWTGSNPFIEKHYPDYSLVLFKTTLENPLPTAKILSMDYISNMKEATPFLLALTVE